MKEYSLDLQQPPMCECNVECGKVMKVIVLVVVKRREERRRKEASAQASRIFFGFFFIGVIETNKVTLSHESSAILVSSKGAIVKLCFSSPTTQNFSFSSLKK